ncbi:MAG: hypothetical protein H6825_10430 [Planctomycetes bacterium]|nr:hypothetical protein [Planctomycetota bacterium]
MTTIVRSPISAPLLAFVLALAVPARAQQVWVVDATGAGDFLGIAFAIDAASSGDTILVRSAIDVELSVPLIDGKSLDIVGDGPAVNAGYALGIRNLAEGQFVRLRNLAFDGGPAALGAEALTCLDNEGLVWVEDCVLTGLNGIGASFIETEAWPAMRVESCAGVIVVRSSLRGGNGRTACASGHCTGMAGDGRPALLAIGSDVIVFESELQGGDGGHDGVPPKQAGAGAPGLRAEDACSVLLVDSLAQGGDGGNTCVNDPTTCVGGGGVQLVGSGNVLRRRHATTAGGLGGLVSGDVYAAPGEDEDVDPGSVVEVLPATPRSLEGTSPVRAGEAGLLRFEGRQGDLVGLFWSPVPGFLYLPGKQSTLALGLPFQGPLFVAAVTSPDGVLQVHFGAPDLTSLGLEALPFDVQCLHVSDGQLLLSSPSTLTIVSPAF